MSKTPLREHLETLGTTAEAWAAEHGFSAWSVRHWSRGDKVPEPTNQDALELATGGVVTPARWLEWATAKRRADVQGSAA